jgi:hypothetical protein
MSERSLNSGTQLQNLELTFKMTEKITFEIKESQCSYVVAYGFRKMDGLIPEDDIYARDLHIT